MAEKRYGIERVCGGDFGQICAELVNRVAGSGTTDGNRAAGTTGVGTVVRIVFFGSPEDNAEYARQLETIKKQVAERFGNRRPVVTFVAQRPLEAGLVAEITTVDNRTGGDVDIRYGGDNLLVINDKTGSELMVGGIRADDPSLNVQAQSERIFGRLGQILDAEGFPVESISRQWNYIESITELDGTRQHYQDFNDARSRFYASTLWEAGYPAATGIGTQGGGVMVELNARKDSERAINIPLDNALQRAAHCYSQQVLVGETDCPSKQKSTPKFERARLVGFPDDATVYVSGTAAIRGEGSLEGSDVYAQTRITMENIEFLCSPENINSQGPMVTGRRREFGLLRVYVKNPEHLGRVKEYMEAHYAEVPKFYLTADVCRPELLVEIEGVAYIR